MTKVTAGVVLFVLVGGCAVNSYKTHYSGTTAQSPEMVERVVAASGPPRVSRGSNPRQDLIAMLEAGYILLGSSKFTGSVPGKKALLEEAASVGASRVILYERYQQTVSGKTSLALPSPATAGGSGGAEGTVGYHGGGTTTEQTGSAVREIPYSVKQYVQLATFWARAKPARVGIYYRSPSEQERGESQRPAGVVVIAVVDDSPADKADVHRGDIILRANGSDVQTPEALKSLLDRASDSISLEILRDGELHRITFEPLRSQ